MLLWLTCCVSSFYKLVNRARIFSLCHPQMHFDLLQGQSSWNNWSHLPGRKCLLTSFPFHFPGRTIISQVDVHDPASGETGSICRLLPRDNWMHWYQSERAFWRAVLTCWPNKVVVPAVCLKRICFANSLFVNPVNNIIKAAGKKLSAVIHQILLPTVPYVLHCILLFTGSIISSPVSKMVSVVMLHKTVNMICTAHLLSVYEAVWPRTTHTAVNTAYKLQVIGIIFSACLLIASLLQLMYVLPKDKHSVGVFFHAR